MLVIFLEKIIIRIYSLGFFLITNKFIRHNLSLFKPNRSNRNSDPIVLMELNDMHSAHIAYSYIGNSLADLFGAQLKAYRVSSFRNWRRSVLFRVAATIGWKYFGVYRSFGVNEFFGLQLSHAQQKRANALCTDVLRKISNKRDIEEISLGGIWVGDLIYDTFLNNFKLPTIDISKKIFRDHMLCSIEKFVFWSDYFDQTNVKAICVSHCVYDLAIPLRIAIERGIPSFQANLTHIYRLNKTNYFAYNDFFYFPERFAQLPHDVQEVGKSLAKERIERRFKGEVGVDMSYSTKSSFTGLRTGKVLRVTNRKKILIATHCFFDSPHGYGPPLFPDFYEWLDFLGRMTEETDYDWYIKIHPDYRQGTKEIIDNFVKGYPKITLLPPSTSHHQIISEGIDVALTCVGTIGFEYAALGIPVINASMNNPHVAYNFNIHAKDVDHYRNLLLSIDDIKIKINKEEIYEYYFMKFIFNTENIFFEDYEGFLRDIGGYNNQFGPISYKKWLSDWTPEKHSEISESIRKFISSGDYRMDSRHTGKQFLIDNINT